QFSVADPIRLLKELKGDKDENRKKGQKEHKKAIEIIEKYISEHGIDINADLDNPDFQLFVKSLGTAMDEFSKDDMKYIVEFVKFMDLYENFDQNEKIKKLGNQVNLHGELDSSDYEQLIELMPAEDTSPTKKMGVPINDEDLPENEVKSLSTNGYDGFAAREYAREWVSNSEILRNNKQFGYYSDYNGGCYSCWKDCTNYVSQALMAGGMIYYENGGKRDSTAWWYNSSAPSFTWGAAQNFYLHWRDRAGVVKASGDLGRGDVVSTDFYGDGSIDHTAMITVVRNAEQYLSQHSIDKKEVSTVGDWFDAGYDVYGYEMDKADN
ncbi:amidase domain-containing protein, partial [Brevibacillus porteri]|nr:amidase domain-containing protein [Brevibacillus porteri]MED2135350.1 amidase domain-containing protein [Brevibacillus porteri]